MGWVHHEWRVFYWDKCCAVSSIAVVEAEVEKCLLKMFETVDLVKSVEEDGLQY